MSTEPRAANAGGAARRESERLAVDVSALPEVVFGSRSILAWGTIGFMIIEGTTLFVLFSTYFYLRLNAAEWPPRPSSNPDPFPLATLNLLWLLAMMWPMRKAGEAGRKFDTVGVKKWLGISLAMGAVAVALRFGEFEVVNVHWTTDAYGSIVWAILTLHTTLLLFDVLESGAILAIFVRGKEEPKHFPDVEDAAVYQYFLSLTWVAGFAMLYLAPRVL